MLVDLLCLVLSFLAGYWLADRFHRDRQAERDSPLGRPPINLASYAARKARANPNFTKLSS